MTPTLVVRHTVQCPVASRMGTARGAVSPFKGLRWPAASAEVSGRRVRGGEGRGWGGEGFQGAAGGFGSDISTSLKWPLSSCGFRKVTVLG